MDWVNIVVNILSSLVMLIPLVIELSKWIKAAIKEKNWQTLLGLVTNFMKEAESKFQTGAERKDYVMLAIKASASTINYEIDMDVVSKLIDDLCAMSKIVNAPKEEVEVVVGS